MIPAMNIIAWGNIAPWAEQRQVEQDLMISRAIVELFTDDFLKEEMRFRGGTALNKLIFRRRCATRRISISSGRATARLDQSSAVSGRFWSRGLARPRSSGVELRRS